MYISHVMMYFDNKHNTDTTHETNQTHNKLMHPKKAAPTYFKHTYTQ